MKTTELAKVFERKHSVSFMNDIAPVLLEEFYGEEMCAQNYEKCESLIRDVLRWLWWQNEVFVCVPKFSGGMGTMNVVDIIYERVTMEDFCI